MKNLWSILNLKKSTLLSFAILLSFLPLKAQDDSYLWLEEIEGPVALEFAAKQSKMTFDKLSKVSEYQQIFTKSLEIYNSTDKIAWPTVHGEFVYNFWKDKDHIRGVWRRTSRDNYENENPNWEILLDLDELSAKENKKWVYEGESGCYPKYEKFILFLSNGGGDAVVMREFDVSTKSFVENGFNMDEAKSRAEYIDENLLLVSTDFGESTMTSSGYPKQVKIWSRGTTLKEAQLIYDGDTNDIEVKGYVMRDGVTGYIMIDRDISTYSTHTFIWLNDKLLKLDIPENMGLPAIVNNQLVVDLKEDWNVQGDMHKSGSLISLDFQQLLKGKKEIQQILIPNEFTSVYSVESTKNRLLVTLLTNVKNEVYIFSFENGKWANEKVNTPDFGAIDIDATDELSDLYYFDFENFLAPTTLFIGDAYDNTFNAIKSLPKYFDGSKYKVEQYKAKSLDGTLIPYFVVSSKNLKSNGTNPTLLYAYGGMGLSEVPFYSGTMGSAWLENGGVYVQANLRGGGEFGPEWHQAGVKEKRQNVFNDFYAVAEDLMAKKITSNKHLGIMGGSNGGLLVGVAFIQRPDLYSAVVCQAPLLDMKRYTKLSAGSSWIGEYGDPEKPEEWEYMKKYSPYQNLKKGMNYPEVFFYTSTKDDRVNPGHARKMAAKMIDLGYPILFYENTEGGHTGPSTNEQRATYNALIYSFLISKLK